MSQIRTRRLTASDREIARSMFTLMAKVFAEPSAPLSDAYLDRLLRRDSLWAIAAFVGDELVGGITAHLLPMTRGEASELFIYDLAVRADWQRQGIGRHLVTALRAHASVEGIQTLFVPADNDDLHALDFYQALGGMPSAVTCLPVEKVPRRSSERRHDRILMQSLFLILGGPRLKSSRSRTFSTSYQHGVPPDQKNPPSTAPA